MCTLTGPSQNQISQKLNQTQGGSFDLEIFLAKEEFMQHVGHINIQNIYILRSFPTQVIL